MLIDTPHLPVHIPWFEHRTSDAPQKSSHTPWFERHRIDRPVTLHRKIGRWILDLTKDPFLGTVRCRLRAKGVTVEHAAVIVQAPRSVNTFDAYYRLDSSPAVSWRVNGMELASHGVTINDETLDNPSGGRVAIPLRLAAAAATISIRASERSRSYSFFQPKLDGALLQARGLGCGADFIIPEAAP